MVTTEGFKRMRRGSSVHGGGELSEASTHVLVRELPDLRTGAGATRCKDLSRFAKMLTLGAIANVAARMTETREPHAPRG
jgi:hypothetical protein